MSAAETESVSPGPSEPGPRGRRRWWRRLLGGVVGLLAAVVAAVLAFLWVPAASQLAVRIGLSSWDEAMPGTVEWRDMSGSLAGGLRVEGVELRDGEGRLLVRAEQLELELDVTRLFAAELAIEDGRAHGLEVWLDHDWAALAPPPEQAPPEKEGYGPDLPLALQVALEVEGGTLHLREEELARLDHLTIRTSGVGRSAELELEARDARLPRQGLHVESLSLSGRWEEPVVSVAQLEVQTPWGSLRTVEGASFDVSSQTGELSLELAADLQELAESLDNDALAQLGADSAQARVEIEGGPELVTLRVDAGVELLEPERHSLRLALDAELAEGPEGYEGRAQLDIDDHLSGESMSIQAVAEARQLSPLQGSATIELHGAGVEGSVKLASSNTRALTASASLTIDEIGDPLAVVAPYMDAPAVAELRGAMELEGTCRTAPGDPLENLRCTLRAHLDHLSGFDTRVAHARLDAVLRPLRDPLALHAGLELEGLRRPELELAEARVEVRGTTRRLQLAAHARGPRESVELAATWRRQGDRHQLALDELELISDRGPKRAHLSLVEPTRITIGPERVGVDELHLRAGGGELAIDGHLGLKGRSSALSVELAEVELARIDPLVPGPPMNGRVDLRGAFTGSLDQPAGWIRVDADRLWVGSLVLGRLELDAQLCGGHSGAPGRGVEVPPTFGGCSASRPGQLSAKLNIRGPTARRVELVADLPLRFDDGVRVRRGRQVFARAQVRALDLAELGGLMPRTPSWWRQVPPDAAAPEGDPRLIPEGRLDLDLAVSGPADAPRAQLLVWARELVIDHTELGSVVVHAQLDEAGLDLALDADTQPGVLELDALLPVSFDLARLELDWNREAEHLVLFELRGLAIDVLERVWGPKLPALDDALATAELDGLVSASLRAQGPLAEPRVWASIDALDLHHRGEELGRLALALDYQDGLAEGTAFLDGPLAERFDAHAELPVVLTLDGSQALVLRPEGPLSGALHAEGLELASLEPHVGPLPLSGRAKLVAELRGHLDDPKLELEGQLRGLRTSGSEVGDLLVRAEADARAAMLQVDLVRRGLHLAAVELEVPVEVELASLDQLRIAWDPTGHHRVLGTGRELDGELIAALTGTDLPIATSSDAVRIGATPVDTRLRFDLHGGGRIDQFELTADLHGTLHAEEQPTLRFDAELELDQARQHLVATLVPKGSEGVKLEGGLEADVPDLIAGEQALRDIPFTLELDAPDLELAELAFLASDTIHDLRGHAHASVSGEGTLSAPRLEGELALHEGELTIIDLRQRLSDIELVVELDEERVELRTLQLTSGAGGVRGSGHVEIADQGGMTGSFELALRELPVLRPGLPAMSLGGELEVDLDIDSEATQLRLGLDEGEVTVARSETKPAKRIPTSEAVEFVQPMSHEGGEGPSGSGPDSEPGATVGASKLDIRFALGDPLLISGAGVDMAWDGALHVDRRGAEIEIGGQLEAQRGRFELLGHRFDLRRGIVTPPADGSLVPYLDIVAVTETAEAEVTVTIRGRATKPELRFSSTPTLSEVQILTLLVTGSTEIGASDSTVEAKAASLLAAVSNPQIQRELNRALGIDRAKIGFGKTIDQPILSIGKRVLPNVWVETTYHHNAPENQNTAEIQVEYNFLPRYSLETYFGDAAVGGIGLYWSHTFGAVKWKEPRAR